MALEVNATEMINRFFRLAVSVALAALTVVAISLIHELPDSIARNTSNDVLTMPGRLLGRLVVPGQVNWSNLHLWLTTVALGDIAFYALLWGATAAIDIPPQIGAHPGARTRGESAMSTVPPNYRMERAL